MISQLSKEQLASLARDGGGLDMYAGDHTAEDLAFIARNIVPGSCFIIRGPASFTPEDLSLIARSGNGAVIFQG